MKRLLAVSLFILLSMGIGSVQAQSVDAATMLVIIDGHPATQKILDQLDKEAIATMEFLPTQKATLIYGAAGANGALLVKTKKQQVPLVIINGKEASADTLSQLSFERIDVLRGQQAINLYGPAAKDGVYMVKTTKEPVDVWVRVENKKGKPMAGVEITDEQGTTLAVTNRCGLAWLEQIEAGKKVVINKKRYQTATLVLDDKKQNIILQKK